MKIIILLHFVSMHFQADLCKKEKLPVIWVLFYEKKRRYKNFMCPVFYHSGQSNFEVQSLDFETWDFNFWIFKFEISDCSLENPTLLPTTGLLEFR